MPENDTEARIRRLTEAMNPFGRILEEMTKAAQMWMSALTPDKSAAESGEELRKASERMVELSGAWIEPMRKLSEEHARFAEEMAMWVDRHREFAEQMSEWAEAHRAVAERLGEWSQPMLRYAELMNESMQALVGGMFPPDPSPGETTDPPRS